MRGLTQRLLCRAAVFKPDLRVLGLIRALIAAAELIGVGFTDDHTLFGFGIGAPGGPGCGGPRQLSLWCMTGQSDGVLPIERLVVVGVLAIVVSGYRPRWTCVPHWYVAFSMHCDVTLGDGGDAVAAITTMLLIPMLLGDRRVWHWSRPRVPPAAAWRGSSYAAWLALRCQLAIIYVQAALSKFGVAQWRQGSAMLTVFVDPNTGLPTGVRHLLAPVLASALLSVVISWSVMAGELLIAVGAITARCRGMTVALACVLHGAIALCMGLFSFSMTMIALVLVLRADHTDHTDRIEGIEDIDHADHTGPAGGTGPGNPSRRRLRWRHQKLEPTDPSPSDSLAKA